MESMENDMFLLKNTGLKKGLSYLPILLSRALCIGAIGFAAVGAQAQIFDTTGSMVGGSPVSVAATFTVTAGNVHISVVNNLVNPSGVIQNLSGLGFTVSTGQTSGGSLTGSSGMERTVAG